MFTHYFVVCNFGNFFVRVDRYTTQVNLLFCSTLGPLISGCFRPKSFQTTTALLSSRKIDARASVEVLWMFCLYLNDMSTGLAFLCVGYSTLLYSALITGYPVLNRKLIWDMRKDPLLLVSMCGLALAGSCVDFTRICFSIRARLYPSRSLDGSQRYYLWFRWLSLIIFLSFFIKPFLGYVSTCTVNAALLPLVPGILARFCIGALRHKSWSLWNRDDHSVNINRLLVDVPRPDKDESVELTTHAVDVVLSGEILILVCGFINNGLTHGMMLAVQYNIFVTLISPAFWFRAWLYLPLSWRCGFSDDCAILIFNLLLSSKAISPSIIWISRWSSLYEVHAVVMLACCFVERQNSGNIYNSVPLLETILFILFQYI